MRLGTVYLVTNKVNGMQYVGATFSSLNARWSQHVCEAKRGKNSLLWEAIRRFGRDAFSVEPLASCWGKAALSEAEEFLTMTWETVEPRGYNRMIGHRHGDVTLRKFKGRIPWQKARPSSRKGVPRSAKTKKRISAALTGRTCSAEHNARNAAAKLGNGCHNKPIRDSLGNEYASMTAAAKKFGVSVATISRAVTGKRSLPNGITLHRTS